MKHIVMAAALLLTVLTCTAKHASGAAIEAFVSIPPQKYFLEKIGGNHVDIHVMVPPGASPHTYEPSPRQMTALSNADLYFTIGITFDSVWIGKIHSANPDLRVIHTDRGIEKLPADSPGDHDHHGHESLDPHTWLSPRLVKIQAVNIADALVDMDPKNENTYKKNLSSFMGELAELDARLRDRLEREAEFLVFHPSWGYFADEYGLKQIPVEIEGKSPKAADIARLIQYAREHDIKTVLVQPQVSSRSAEMIARSIDGKTVIADPLAEDWAENLLRVADRIQGN